MRLLVFCVMLSVAAETSCAQTQIRIDDGTGRALIQMVQSLSGASKTIKWPGTNGASGYVLSTNGANPALLSWIPASGSSNAVIVDPATSARNLIKPTTDAIALRLQNFDAGSTSLEQTWEYDNGSSVSTVASMSNQGELILSTPLGIASGGTNQNTFDANSFLYFSGTSIIDIDGPSNPLTALQYDASGIPIASGIDVSQTGTLINGILNHLNGGTGHASYSTGDLLYGSGGGLGILSATTNGYVLTLASGIPAWQAATAIPGTISGDVRINGDGSLGQNASLYVGTYAPYNNGIISEQPELCKDKIQTWDGFITGGPNLSVEGYVQFNNGAGTQYGILTTPLTLTGNRFWLLPDAGGTLALTSQLTSGSVTSVAVSGGTTGLTTSGGPITTSGTITLAGTLVEANGGTHQTTYTTGDLLYASASNTLSKRAIGSTGNLLTVSSGIPTWAAPASTFTVAQTIQIDNIGAATTDALILINTTAAAAGGQQWSPRLRLSGQGWKTNATAASRQLDWYIENETVQGAANPASDLVFSTITNSGTPLEQLRFHMDNGGTEPTLYLSGKSSSTDGAGATINMGEAATGAAGDCKINGQNAGGTNSFGGNFVFQAGLSTGNKSGQSLLFRSSYSGSSGTTLTSAQQLMALAPSGTAASNPTVTATFGKSSTVTGIINLCQSGSGNAPAGTATLVGGFKTVNTAAIKTGDLVFLTETGATAANIFPLATSNIVNGVSFDVTSASPLDTSTFNWVIIRPN